MLTEMEDILLYQPLFVLFFNILLNIRQSYILILYQNLFFIIYKLTNPLGPIPVFLWKGKVGTTWHAKGFVTHSLVGLLIPIL